MFYNKVKESAGYISSIINTEIDVAVILGSGLGKLVDIMEEKIYIPYKDIPNFPVISVVGHAGNIVYGKIGNTKVLALQGRFHYYEGFTMKETAYPVYVMKLLNIKKMIVTNACGGINPNFKPGDLMIIDDFINSVSDNPLRGSNDERFGVRFPDMSEPYSLKLRNMAKSIADDLGIETKNGVYTFFQGPYYETAAEIRMYGRSGSDAIGMSTVPETIVANYVGIETLGISCITNMATGLRVGSHSHEEVVAIAEETSKKLCKWMEEFIRQLKK
ncbi:purine-nucleoside phosphorylase [Streptobacillus felis]|uniref:Purine nucleoside phosphorylase n=1 Tax=Streptobacillus felis TaxID=1384509 RepID=A0A7Z0PEA1_9FUSO|nr:purine-nucleoside phosphorylase [Streptobacillus felis]NYV27434.1 purine-nucleoside phosphorylase [Streptobacillus felis]